MAVFISHSSVDNAAARQVYEYLHHQGTTCYLDDVDRSLLQAPDITAAIVAILSTCSHLLAVVSASTVWSWWVPFEIGVGTVKEARITTYCVSHVDLPSYLRKWPVLTSMFDLQVYAQHYDRDARVLLEKSMPYSAAAASVKTASDFHHQLKQALRQT